MGTSRALPLRSLLLLLLIAVAPGRGRTRFAFPLQVSLPVAPDGSLVPTPVLVKPPGSRGASGQEAAGLALASDSGSPLNYAAMVDNLQGDSGRGYYLELQIGTPPQKVSR
ncbi:hypothetical protein lerEdw1_011864 [Lerista edwardsae]|nr:hypothetical protein lerEdw1_011864 [Lerista edwardsae]